MVGDDRGDSDRDAAGGGDEWDSGMMEMDSEDDEGDR